MDRIPRVVIRLAIDKKDGGTVGVDFDAPAEAPPKPARAAGFVPPAHVHADSSFGGALVCDHCGRREAANVFGDNAVLGMKRFAAAHKNCPPRDTSTPKGIHDDFLAAFPLVSSKDAIAHKEPLQVAAAHATDESLPMFLQIAGRGAMGANRKPGVGSVYSTFYPEAMKWLRSNHFHYSEGQSPHEHQYLAETPHGKIKATMFDRHSSGEIEFHPHRAFDGIETSRQPGTPARRGAVRKKEGHTIEPLYPDLKSTGESPFRKALVLRLAIDRNDKGATRSLDFDAPQGGSAPTPKPPARNLTLGENWSRRDDHHRAFSNYSPEKVDRHRDQLLTARAHETDPSTPDFLRMQARSAQGASMTPGSGAIFPAFYGETRKWFERHHVGHQQVKREGDAMPHEEFLVETKHGNVLGRFPTGPRLQGEVQFHPHGSMADFPRVRKVRKAACASGARLGLAVPDGFEPLRKSLRARGLTDQQATAAALRAIQRGRR